MIIVNYWHDADYDPSTDGFDVTLAGVINDVFDLYSDPQLIIQAIENDPDFNPKPETLYQLQLVRATIESDPVPEPAFCIDRVIENKYNEVMGWHTEIIRL